MVNHLENGLQRARLSTVRKLSEALEVPAGAFLAEDTQKGDDTN